ncbi:Fimbrial assembly protein (PilN) [Peptoclostridium litorale DSM 5388]|uniref:Fimbrial assembly family protein n=1 Tax=Peptoclostridium litorale DSM 5388 TaxID=1121324 RepID=A0A069RHS0_PEPLI|nr:PilN domain-containing protein [Peptoclostridium litorale]KDR93817.1 hypothetical protein CLIT_23c00890 [Peptoclostridium litorale DSM 5388]SIN86441.1 Fimbrial assembly protein (PilN) [Peptoclostridium litorale DSM 5388]
MLKLSKFSIKGKLNLNKNENSEIEKLKRKNINLLPAEYIKSQNRKRNVALSITASIVLVGFLAGAYVWIDKEIENTILENEKLSKNISELEEIKSQQDFLENIDEKIYEKKLVLEFIEKSNISATAFFKILEKNLPKDIGFIDITGDENEDVVINGSAQSEVSVAELLYNLKSEKMFKEVFVSNISTQSEEGSSGYTFSITCKFGREK